LNTGLIGTWSPGIGDPSIAGWLTVLLYVVAAWVIWRLLHDWKNSHARNARYEPWFWKTLLMGLVLLGINKQLDLQSALTEIGRILAARQGWYADRQQIQIAFIAGIAIMGLTLFAATLHMIWGAPSATVWALLGSTVLVLFVILRAASFHHVDAVLGHSFYGLRINWLLEMGGLLVIIASAWRRRGQHLCT
jgi:uncharacterized membrane protein (UPF0136 family)